jgi:hypothetical protein
MRSSDSLESMLHRLRYATTPERRRGTLENIYGALDEFHKQTPATSRTGIGRLSMKTTTGKLALAAAVIVIVLGGITFWPFGGANTGKWWLASPAALGQELRTALDTIKAVTCREQTVFVAADGSQHTSSTWDRFYTSSDSYRRDISDGDALREIQWYVPDGNEMVQHYVRFDLKCYGAVRHSGGFGADDPVERMRFYIGLLDRADRLLGEQVIDGHNCVGFEIRASKYGDNPETWVDHIWFDVQTRLPVRMEKSGRPVTGDPTSTFTTVQDQFDFASQFPADTFIPQVPPAGFVNAHPDELQRQ